MHIAIITAGGAGMFCGSCMHDNTWARALIAAGAEVSLVPTYTPLRVDEANQSLERVFFGGVNVYLNSRSRWWRSLPRFATVWLDRPAFINLATRWSVSNNAAQLGDLTLSMLAGDHGPHRLAAEELAQFLARDLRPDVVIFSNALLSGALPALRRHLSVPVLCALQGDDVFLDSLPESHRQRVIDAVGERARGFDAFLTHTRFYRDYISRYLSLPVEKFHDLPLGIDVAEHTGRPVRRSGETFTVGYFARLAPEKGLHNLIAAFSLLQRQMPHARLRIGGYQGPPFEDYVREMEQRLREAGIHYENVGSPATVEEKVAFLESLDVLSVPTQFLEPKGIYVLEAMANGIPVVQPDHGSFPELLQATGGGLLVPPSDPQALAEGLAALVDPDRRLERAEAGWTGVRQHFTSEVMARRTLEIIGQLVRSRDLPSVQPSSE